MTEIDRFLADLAKYWRTSLEDEYFVQQLSRLGATYPRIFDAVEERIFTQLRKRVPPTTAAMSTEDTKAWLASLKNAAGLAALREREEQREKADAAVAAAAQLNASRQFDLMLFDLDDTLVQSAHLEEFRGRENIDNRKRAYVEALVRQARQLTRLVTEDVLINIRTDFPDLRLGVFTRAPKVYTETLLSQCYPAIEWDCVVTYEDVNGHTKPRPDGIHLAAQKMRIPDMNRIAVVGDEMADVAAAYQAGAFAILLRDGWGPDWNNRDNPRRSEHYRALDLIPDAIVNRAGDILPLIPCPWEKLPALESWEAATGDQRRVPGMRVDARFHFNNLQPRDQGSNWVLVEVMGRYFAAHHHGDHFDFRPKALEHPLTREILAAKDGDEYPESWIHCCSRRLSVVADDLLPLGARLLVCPVPARLGRPRRLERLIDRLADCLGAKEGLAFDPAVLRFRDGAAANKSLNQAERFINIRDHLLVADPSTVKDMCVIVIDDVTTSGATFYYADRYLKASGARNVQCIALAQAVS